MQRRPKVIFGVSTAVGALVAITGMVVASPASAATAPTFNVPPIGVGWGDIVLTGTAAPHVRVTLHERAYKWGREVVDPAGLETAESWDHPATVTSGADGRWAITRTMDSGFVFSVEAEGLYSRIVKAPLRVGVELTVTAGAAGVVGFVARASPDQPGLEGVIQRYTSSGWTTVATGQTVDAGDGRAQIMVSAGNEPAGVQHYRALLQESAPSQAGFADYENWLLANYSPSRSATVAGSSPVAGPVPPAGPAPAVPAEAVSPAVPGGTPAPTPSRPTSASPTPSRTASQPPTPKPTATTRPPAPKPSTPPAGSVQFTRIQYNAPGKDTTRNTSVNGEYFQLTNKTRTAFNLKSWTVRDRAGNLYRFTTDHTLAAGKSVVVRTGKGTNTKTTRYWNKKSHVWNNTGDAATLKSPQSTTIDSCAWPNSPTKTQTTC